MNSLKSVDDLSADSISTIINQAKIYKSLPNTCYKRKENKIIGLMFLRLRHVPIIRFKPQYIN